MIQSIPRGARWRIVETLLNTLEVERYVRGPLLLNIIDELSASESWRPAVEMARRLVKRLEAGPISDTDFRERLGELRTCFGDLARQSDRETVGRGSTRKEEAYSDTQRRRRVRAHA